MPRAQITVTQIKTPALETTAADLRLAQAESHAATGSLPSLGECIRCDGRTGAEIT